MQIFHKRKNYHIIFFICKVNDCIEDSVFVIIVRGITVMVAVGVVVVRGKTVQMQYWCWGRGR